MRINELPLNVAIQLPGPCNYKCSWCSTGNANTSGVITRATKGNIEEIKRQIANLGIDSRDHVHITGSGEPGLSKGFKPVIELLNKLGSLVSVCCAGPRSIPEPKDCIFINRADISCNQYTEWEEAVFKAKEKNIIVIATKVDSNGELSLITPEQIAQDLDVNGVLIRALRTIGLAAGKQDTGTTRWWTKETIPFFPSAAFPEFKNVQDCLPITCINENGQIIDYLGQPSESSKNLIHLEVKNPTSY